MTLFFKFLNRPVVTSAPPTYRGINFDVNAFKNHDIELLP